MAEPSGGGSGSRLLLRRLRDLMAAGGSAQQRLDRVVKLIAANMVAEVCSVYILRAGEVLELFATEGLKPEAVHLTRLRVGEGLVGEIAARPRPLALAEARDHPAFVYRPETGEEEYHSLLGVPILRAGRVIGVLVVQNRTPRNYQEEEVETLQTVAMVLAELVTGGGVQSAEEALPADGITPTALRLDGQRVAGGLAMGRAVLHEPRITITRIVAEDSEVEWERVRAAVDGMQDALKDLFSADDIAHGGEHRDVLEVYRMFAEDSGWLARIREGIRTGLTAEAAVQRAQEDTSVRMSQVRDPYLRERLHDFEDLNNRLLAHLVGEHGSAADPDLPDDMILLARSMGPAELLDYDRTRLKALVLEEGSATSHVAIVARALEIPVVGRVRGVLDRIEPLDLVIVDGEHAQVLIRPGEELLQSFAESLLAHDRRQAAYAALRDVPAVTSDGTAISLQLNAGLPIDMRHLAETGADGIGLYRTEIPFMTRTSFPDTETQRKLYRRVLDEAEGKRVVFRTLDIGGDKVLPYFGDDEDRNPALGWRAVRVSLDRPAILRRQLRALIRAAAGRELNIMFPMISEVAELDALRRILDMELEQAGSGRKSRPDKVRVGVMLEVPALIWQLDTLLQRVDFLSVGSNDLVQFLFASDRSNPRMAERYDALSPPVLALLRSVVRSCEAAGVPLALCGEMGGNPLDAMALLGVGFRSLSMAAPSIAPVKQMIRGLNLSRLEEYLATLDGGADHSLRAKLRAYAQDHGILV